MIRTPPANDAYRDNWERVFNGSNAPSVDVPNLIKRLVAGYRDSGGSPDGVFVVSLQTYGRCAEHLVAFPVEIRSWVPPNRLLLESRDDLAKQDAIRGEMSAALAAELGIPVQP